MLLTAMQIGFVSSVGLILTMKAKMVCMHRDVCAANVMIVTETLWWSESDIARKVVSLEEEIKTNDKMTNVRIWSVVIFDDYLWCFFDNYLK